MRRILVLALLFAAAVVQAQRKSPVVSPQKTEQNRELAPGLVARLSRPTGYSMGALTRNERAVLATRGRIPRIGVHRPVDRAQSSNAKWEALPDGTSVWRFAIGSTGAEGLRIQFGDFSAGAGKVWVYGDDGQSQGPYTGKGVFENGEFWSGTVWGDKVTIEYQPADPADRQVPFQIRSIAHRETAKPRSAIQTLDAVLAPSATTPGPAPDPAANCNLDVMCYPDWSDAVKMVSEMHFETEENGQQFEAACSGTLVATRDNSLKPYLLTANHCISNETDARTLETFWTYQTSNCRGPVPLLKDSTTSQVGADYIAGGGIRDGDYSLLLLKGVPAGVLYSGWDAREVPLGSDLVGVHHPAASFKRILFGHRTSDLVVDVEGDILPPNLYYVLSLDNGIAQPGSSGSALFSSPGVIVGTLTYGPVADNATLCSLGSFDIGYGRFSVAYPNLMGWLEDLPYSEVKPATPDVSFTITDGVVAGGLQKTVMLTTQSANPVTFSVRPDATWIQVSPGSLSTSATKPAPLTVNINPKLLVQAGTYTGTVTIQSGVAPPQFVNVHVQVNVDVSNVTATATPNPVNQGSDGLWSYTVELDESAGVSTRVTLLRIDGRDYSNQIVSWFGSDHLSGGGSLQVPLKSQVLLVPATQTIELGGIDDLSHKNWYRVLTVSLLGQ
jgi:hypothetical protein